MSGVQRGGPDLWRQRLAQGLEIPSVSLRLRQADECIWALPESPPEGCLTTVFEVSMGLPTGWSSELEELSALYGDEPLFHWPVAWHP